MSQVNLNGASNVSGTLLDNVARSPQMAFALLQMKLAEANKNEAMNGIHSIEATQAKKAEMAEMLNKARDYKQNGLHLNDAGIPSGIDDKFAKYCNDNGITVPHYAKYADSKEDLDKKWDSAIAQMQTKMDTIGSNIQTKMVQLQDMMGQYNSYMQGANSAIATSNQTLSSLARGQ
ncbi:MAG: USH1C-binding protein 1 [Desulfovibrionaceae bacterium]|nr:USH1C-binding protein 1 [Desulfovibrionaceae bacterium]